MGIGSNAEVVEPSEQGIVEPSIEQPDSIEDNLEYIRRMKDRKMVIFDEPKEINTTNVFEILEVLGNNKAIANDVMPLGMNLAINFICPT